MFATKRRTLAVLFCFSLACPVRAEVPPAEQLLPDDTVVLLAVPSWEKLAGYYQGSPLGGVWRDPSVQPFRTKLAGKIREEICAPLERELAIKFSDFAGLLRGQLTLAVTQTGPGESPGVLFLLDSQDKKEQLAAQLSQLKKRWTDAGKKLRTEMIRNVEFTTIMVDEKDVKQTLEKAFPGQGAEAKNEEEEGKPAQLELTFGLSDSLLVVGNHAASIEKVLVRQSGGPLPTLAEQSAYQASRENLFRDSLFYGWLHFQPIYNLVLKNVNAQNQDENNPMAPKPEKILSAVGLSGLKTGAFSARGGSDGSTVELFLGVPESGRQGLFKMIMPEGKDALPPSFVPADAMKFNRWRIDGQKVFAAFEGMVNNVSPELGGFLQFAITNAGKDRDPEFDLRKNLVGNLGDDVIMFQKPPRAATLEALNSPPTAFLLGSPNPEKLAAALKVAAGLLPLPPAEGGDLVRERDFLGRKIYSLSIPAPGGGEGRPALSTLSFSATASYVVLSTDTAVLEEQLRSAESAGKSLRETAGLVEAAQKVGGTSTGIFGFENQKESFRVVLETLKKDPTALEAVVAQLSGGKAAEGNALSDWLDFSLLPSFDSVAKYFSFMVYAGKADANGFTWKIYSPHPPQSQ